MGKEALRGLYTLRMGGLMGFDEGVPSQSGGPLAVGLCKTFED